MNNVLNESDLELSNSLQEYVNLKIRNFERLYKISEINKYSGGVIKNLCIFTKNLKLLKDNRLKASAMSVEYSLFYKKPELLGYSKYIKYYNSVSYQLKNAIKNGISQKENNEFADKNAIANWIINYCNDNDLEISYKKR